jgi:hypothetical protein
MRARLPPPRDQAAYCWNESDRHFHDRGLGTGLDFSRCFGVTLRFVILEYFSNARLVPSGRVFGARHRFLLRKRRMAFFAFGPGSNAVMTNPESATASGT